MVKSDSTPDHGSGSRNWVNIPSRNGSHGWLHLRNGPLSLPYRDRSSTNHLSAPSLCRLMFPWVLFRSAPSATSLPYRVSSSNPPVQTQRPPTTRHPVTIPHPFDYFRIVSSISDLPLQSFLDTTYLATSTSPRRGHDVMPFTIHCVSFHHA